MPVKVERNKDGSYKVTTPSQTHAHHTTRKNAEAQARLLNAIEHGFKPTGRKPTRGK